MSINLKYVRSKKMISHRSLVLIYYIFFTILVLFYVWIFTHQTFLVAIFLMIRFLFCVYALSVKSRIAFGNEPLQTRNEAKMDVASMNSQWKTFFTGAHYNVHFNNTSSYFLCTRSFRKKDSLWKGTTKVYLHCCSEIYVMICRCGSMTYVPIFSFVLMVSKLYRDSHQVTIF